LRVPTEQPSAIRAALELGDTELCVEDESVGEDGTVEDEEATTAEDIKELEDVAARDVEALEDDDEVALQLPKPGWQLTPQYALVEPLWCCQHFVQEIVCSRVVLTTSRTVSSSYLINFLGMCNLWHHRMWNHGLESARLQQWMATNETRKEKSLMYNRQSCFGIQMHNTRWSNH
jgi:hypothetical protein